VVSSEAFLLGAEGARRLARMGRYEAVRSLRRLGTDGLSQQALALAARDEDTVAGWAERGLLTPDDVDPAARPAAALGLLSEGAGKPEWARMLAADPLTDHREKLAACPNLPPDVIELLAADTKPTVIAELALWTTAAMAARLAKHPHAEVRAAAAANEATPPLILASLVTGESLPPALSCLVCDNERPPFVDAAIRRADQFRVMAGADELPKIFEVMRQDLKDAADCLHQFSQGL
jgi:hypothetical protein